MVSFTGWTDTTLRSVEKIGEKLGAEDDWCPTLLVDAERGFQILPLVGHLAEHEGLIALEAVVAQMRPVRQVARIWPAWGLEGKDYLYGQLEQTEPRPRGHPDRIEMLIVGLASADHSKACRAKVVRTPSGPVLSPWDTAEMTGPVGDSLRRMAAS